MAKEQPQVRVPQPATLRRYGLTEAEWKAELDAQGGVCAICGSVPPSGILHIDHDHVRGFKTMQPWQRKKFIRGLICWFDNSVMVRRGATPARLRAAAAYLEKYMGEATP